MFWEDEDDKTLPFKASDDVFDVLFAIQCKSLPIDHAWALSQQLQIHLPWIIQSQRVGIHQIHVAESNNGWQRPDNDTALLHPSRRSKLVLRIHREQYANVKNLTSKTLSIEDYEVKIGKHKKRSLSNAGVLFSRYMIIPPNQNENDFLREVAAEIKTKTGTAIKKMLCGKTHTIKHPEGNIHTIHLMIADLDNETSIKIQEEGLGAGRELGCGIFLPHKSIKTLKPTE